MSRRTAVANGADPVQQQAAADASAVQDAVNLVAVVGCFHCHLLALHRSGVCGDDLINHPVSLAFVSKLNSLCRMTLDREMRRSAPSIGSNWARRSSTRSSYCEGHCWTEEPG